MSTTIIIPTLNEANNIGRLLEEISTYYPKVKIIVADDGSSDGTQRLVRSFRKYFLLDHSKQPVHGLTASVLDAAKIVTTDYIIVMDGDYQHPPSKIGEVIFLLKNYDLVVCVRKNIKEWSLKRRLISKTAYSLARIKIGKLTSDPLSGFFGIRTRLFKEVVNKNEKRFQKQGFKVLFDLLKCLPKGTKIMEVPYEFGVREAGSSKLSKKQIISYLRAVFK